MRFSSLVGRIDAPGAAAWHIHHEARQAQARGEDVIVLSVGDPDFPTPEAIVRRAVAALEAGDTHYTDIPGKPALRQAIADLATRHSGQPVSAANVTVVAGAQNGLFAASLCIFEPGDEAIVLEPMYVTYEATLAAAGAKLVTVPSPASSGFRLNVPALRAAVSGRTKAIVFANPNNPTGVVLTKAELAAIAELAISHDLWVIVDEVYESLVFDGQHVPLRALPGMAERTVTIGSLSKSHAMTGWRVGWVLGSTDLATHLESLALNMFYGLPGFVQEGALEAVLDYEDTTGAMRDVYRRRRDLVVGLLSGCPGVAALSPQSGMFVLLDIRATGLTSLDFAWTLLRKAGVSLLDAAAFGACAEGFVRLSFTAGEPELAEACARIRRFAGTLMADRQQKVEA